jgi:hypothetical protein
VIKKIISYIFLYDINIKKNITPSIIKKFHYLNKISTDLGKDIYNKNKK